MISKRSASYTTIRILRWTSVDFNPNKKHPKSKSVPGMIPPKSVFFTWWWLSGLRGVSLKHRASNQEDGRGRRTGVVGNAAMGHLRHKKGTMYLLYTICGTGSKAVKQTTKERFNEMEKAPAHRTDRSFHSTIKSESECRPMASRALWSEIVADTHTTHGERVRRGCLTCHFHTPSIQEDIWTK